MKLTRMPGIVFQPETHRAMQRGMNQIIGAIRPTLGPSARTVAIDYLMKQHAQPELLDSGGLIARRIIELSDSHEDVGAMLIRAVICRQQDLIGDGTATAAVLFQAIYDQGLRYIAAGGNAMRLRHHLEAALPLVLDEVERQSFPIEGQEALSKMAESLSHDPPMADLLGEIFDVIGEYGQLDIRKDQGRGLRREYVEGVYYNSGLFSRAMVRDKLAGRTEFQDAHIFLCDFGIDEPRDLFPVIETAVEAKIRSLAIISRYMSEATMSLVQAANKPDRFEAMAIKLPDPNPVERMAALEDLAMLTGASPMREVTGDSLSAVTAAQFGRARRVWATPQLFGIHSGRGNPRTLREHLARLEKNFQAADDPDVRQTLEKRIGKLSGGSATLWIGGATKPEIDMRKALAERAASTLRSAVREGVVPGGGLALMNVRPALEKKLAAAKDADERAAYGILLEAMKAPARAIFENAGYESSEIMAKLSFADRGQGFDVLADDVVNMADAGILDCTAVQKAAARNAIATAALALTIDVLVHHRKPEIVGQPG